MSFLSLILKYICDRGGGGLRGGSHRQFDRGGRGSCHPELPWGVAGSKGLGCTLPHTHTHLQYTLVSVYLHMFSIFCNCNSHGLTSYFSSLYTCAYVHTSCLHTITLSVLSCPFSCLPTIPVHFKFYCIVILISLLIFFHFILFCFAHLIT